jgi:hypothetical protein
MFEVSKFEVVDPPTNAAFHADFMKKMLKQGPENRVMKLVLREIIDTSFPTETDVIVHLDGFEHIGDAQLLISGTAPDIDGWDMVVLSTFGNGGKQATATVFHGDVGAELDRLF